ncbi:MAG TPA: AbrB/MazE/SpoVT family DNA-binding domain-containing protein [Thermoanaerobaculia bacterium]|nr:AbrB/MazE/SpoVT family DNA-binding domain-containing protein [Thermoanaerobaculia bacterium]
MSKVTSKRQVTIPKRIADEYGIEPGDDIAWQAEGTAIRVVLRPATGAVAPTVEERLKLFDHATERQRRRQGGVSSSRRRKGRGWTREELYERGVSR